MKTLLLWLEGPLQSWGTDSRFQRRTTMPFPSRSGVLGMLCCAMGRGGEQREWLARLRHLDQSVLAFARKGREILARQYLCDFQMAGSGYDTKDPWQDMLVPKTREGKRPVGPGSKMTFRYYLQDMAFACALSMPDELADEAAQGLQHPIWAICLGRKNCTPSAPVFAGVFADESEALSAARRLAGEKRTEVFRVVPGADEEGETMSLNDVPLCFGLHKEYASRYVTVIPS